MATTLGSYLYSERLRYGTILILTISALTYLSIIYLLLSSVKTELVVRTFFSQEFISALMLSFFGALISSLLVFPSAIFTAYILARSNSFLSLLTESMLTTPYTLTPVAVGGLVLLFITQTPIGHLINKIMNLLFTLNGIIFIQAILSFSAMISPMIHTFKSINVEYEELSRVLGHGFISTFLRISLPLARRGILISFLIGFMKAFSDFGATVMVAGIIIGKTATLPSMIYLQINSGDIEQGLALILLLLLVSLFTNSVMRVWGYR